MKNLPSVMRVNILKSAGASPLQLHGIKSNERVKYAKQLVEKTSKNLQQTFANALNVDVGEIETDEPQSVTTDLASDMRSLLETIKQKLENTTNNRKKTQLLKLIPTSWTNK